MNVIKAAEETMELWRNKSPRYTAKAPELTLDHCERMLDIMKSSDFSYGKLCRWLGWMQAACVAGTDLTLEDMKQINLKNKEDVPHDENRRPPRDPEWQRP